MAKPNIPNQKSKYLEHDSRLDSHTNLINQVHETYNLEASKLALMANYDGTKPFLFSDFPQTNKLINKLQVNYSNDIKAVIVNGIKAEWENSNKVQNQLVRKVCSFYGIDVNNADFSKKFSRYFSNNHESLSSFIERKRSGLNLSQRVWNLSYDYKSGLEAALSVGIDKGTSAKQLSKKVSKYLNNFESLRSSYTERFGKANNILDCEYRSARLARTEINMAYRTAEQERWSQLDFVVGYEIKRSGRPFPCSVCESLAGKYPKGFKFTGWHPSCRCYVIPILKSKDEFFDDSITSVNEVKKVPGNFKDWIAKNNSRIVEAKTKGTLPYFLKDNSSIINIKAENISTQVVDNLSKVQTLSALSSDDIKNAILYNNTTEEVFMKNGDWTIERKKLHDEIIKKVTDAESSQTNSVFLLGGGTANGKSSLVRSNSLPYPKKIITVDSDEIKAMLPEYKSILASSSKLTRSNAANFVHEESSYIVKNIQNELAKQNKDYILDGINDGGFEKLKKKIFAIKLQGKRIRADYVTLDIDKSLKFAAQRAIKTGREVPRTVILNSNKDISALFPHIVENKLIDDLYLWDTNISGSPILIMKQIDGKVTMYDQKLYDNFIKKSNYKEL